jgi:hypothetical protein
MSVYDTALSSRKRKKEDVCPVRECSSPHIFVLRLIVMNVDASERMTVDERVTDDPSFDEDDEVGDEKDERWIECRIRVVDNEINSVIGMLVRHQ